MIKGKELHRPWRAASALTVATLVVGGTGASSGCLNRPLEPQEPRTTTTIVERLTQSAVDKIDLVLAIDNSRSMADKQAVLAAAVPDLVQGLVNPACVNPETFEVQGNQPTDPQAMCDPGTVREFDPIVDIHIGIITSSIGGHGSDSCPDSASSPVCGGGMHPTNNDRGHLIARADACTGGVVPTWNDKGFLAWDPTQEKKNPPGEQNVGNLIGALTDMVVGAGQVGCGYEAQLESIYRFLVDPKPYEKITVVNGKATPEGEDEVITKQQRVDFLRSNSLLAVIMLTDENDCSVREYGQFYFATQLKSGNAEFHLPRARAECESNPNDPCCKSCGQAVGDCPADAECEASPQLSKLEDAINLRCWEQKRRFGIDFLYPVERYINMFTKVSINPADDRLEGSPSQPNPLYTNLQNDGSSVRDPGLVFFAGIIGVPWQLIARDAADLKKGFKNSDELDDDTGDGSTTWDKILGNPAEGVKASDPHMIESVDPRPGLPTSGLSDPIHGHEWDISAKRDDLQYACIFDLETSVDCTDPANVAAGCDCVDPGNDNPLCEGATQQDQARAKAYPGLRQLQVLRGIGTQGIVASVCPAQLSDTMALDYGYRPSIRAIIDRLKTALGGQCLPRTLKPDTSGQVSCLILEATIAPDGKCGSCKDPPGRQAVTEDHVPAVEAAKADPIYQDVNKDTLCFCEIIQFKGSLDTDNDPLDMCQNDTSEPVQDANGNELHGWCYIDATSAPPIGDPVLVEKCPSTERRIIRFVGEAEAQAGATQFITCAGEQ